MSITARPNADYLRLPVVPKKEDVGLPGFILPPRLYSPEEYEWAVKQIFVRRGRDNLVAERARIIATTFHIERVVSTLADAEIKTIIDRYCLVDKYGHNWCITNPLIGPIKAIFELIKPENILLAWTTTNEIEAAHAAARLRKFAEEVTYDTVESVLWHQLEGWTTFLKSAQNLFKEHMMREWMAVPLATGDAGQHVRSYLITCGTCGDVEAYKAAKFGASTASDVVPKHFRQRGWTVGKNPEGDVCPECNAKLRAERRAAKLSAKPASQVQPVCDAPSPALLPAPTPISAPNPVSAPKPLPDPPAASGDILLRQPTRAQNRIIQDAIAAHYPVPEAGYLAGMTDERIADETGLPVAWIASHRERFFGPAERVDLAPVETGIASLKNKVVASEEAALKEVAALRAEIEACAATMKALLGRSQELEDRVLSTLDALNEEIGTLATTVDGIRSHLSGEGQ